jgi:hypothetical protein
MAAGDWSVTVNGVGHGDTHSQAIGNASFASDLSGDPNYATMQRQLICAKRVAQIIVDENQEWASMNVVMAGNGSATGNVAVTVTKA